LGELTTQARTIFYGDVRLDTDSWRVQLHSPSGGTFNYDSEAVSEASPVFLGVPPTYTGLFVTNAVRIATFTISNCVLLYFIECIRWLI